MICFKSFVPSAPTVVSGLRFYTPNSHPAFVIRITRDQRSRELPSFLFFFFLLASFLATRKSVKRKPTLNSQQSLLSLRRQCKKGVWEANQRRIQHPSAVYRSFSF